MKIAGPLLAGGAASPTRVDRVIELLTPALLTSLVATSTVAEGRHLILDARAAGVVVGAIVLMLRANLLVALTAARSPLPSSKGSYIRDMPSV